VIAVGVTPHSLLPALSRNIPALHEELVKAEPTFEMGDFPAALALAQRLLGGSGTIYIFSDFQKSNWDAVRELPAGTICRLRPVTTEPVDNIALVSARLLPEEPVAGEAAEAVCTVFNCTARPREETVRLQAGEFNQERRLTVPPFATAEAAFNVTFSQEGTFTGKAWLEPDDLREDNTRYLAIRVHKQLQMLLLSDSDANDYRSAAFFMSRALVPSVQAAPGFHLIRRHSQDTDRGILETADVFIPVAPVTLSGEALEIITRRVQEGARFLAVLDGPTAPALIPAAFNPPFHLERMLVSDAGESVLPGLRKLFSDADPGDWSGVRFRRHYRTQVLDGRSGDVLLSYADGSAALTFSPVGKGAAVFANLPLTPDGGDFIGSPLFPATIHELMRTLRRSSEIHSVNPGTSWVLEAPRKGEGSLTISDPEGGPVEGQLLASGRAARLAMPAARLPGIYTVKQGGVLVGAEAVNVDARESDTRPIALDKLKGGAGTAISVMRDERDLLLAGKAKPLWPQLAITAAVLLALEMILLALWRRSTPHAGGGNEVPTPITYHTSRITQERSLATSAPSMGGQGRP